MKKRFRFVHYISWSVLFAFAVMACGGDQKAKEDDNAAVASLQAMEREVIDVHDEVMPKMATLNNTRVKLLKQYGDENLSVEKRTGLSTAIMHLEEADSLMWDWMHNYNRPDYDGNLDSVRVYLENEMVTVTIMRDKFVSSMEEGEALLTKFSDDDH